MANSQPHKVPTFPLPLTDPRSLLRPDSTVPPTTMPTEILIILSTWTPLNSALRLPALRHQPSLEGLVRERTMPPAQKGRSC